MLRSICLFVLLLISLPSFSQLAINTTVSLSHYRLDGTASQIKIIGIPAGEKATIISGKDLVAIKKDQLTLSKKALRQLSSGSPVQIELGLSSSGRKKFILMTDQFKKNKVIAHRGAWKNTGAPQNSLASLQQAIDLGCEGSEFDVHMTADKVLVLNHDADYYGLKIEETSYTALLEKKLQNGESIPTLRSILELGMKQNKTKLIVEVKPSAINKARGVELAEQVVSLVHEIGAQAWVDYISFDYDILKKILEVDPSAKVAFLNGNIEPDQLKKDGFYGADYHFSVFQKNPGWLSRMKELGLTINSWTVNSEALMDWLLTEGAHFITTDEPELLLKKVSR